jgi:dTDP-4-amino-4,6-dideoxygalactose transaminase
MLNTEFSPWPSFTEEEVEAVSEVLRSNRVNYWTGKEARQFEEEFARFVGVSHAIALANGTVALDLALRAMDIGEGDEVIVTPRTFIASVSCIVNLGAKPVFADVEFDSQNISAKTIKSVITPATKAVICVHLAGWPCDMDPILALAKEHNLWVIEDCAQAHGATYKGKSVGSLGHIGCWSFCQDKIMTTGGEGGMVTTDDKRLWSAMWSYKDHGKAWETVQQTNAAPGFRWLHESFGSNYRMTEMQAAIGRIQLQRMPEWHRVRIDNASRIWAAALDLPNITVPKLSCDSCTGSCKDFQGCEHAAYKCYLTVEASPQDRDELIRRISERGVPCYSGSCSEVYLEKAFEGTGYVPLERLPNALKLGETSLMFLCHPTLTEQEIDKTCRILREVVLDYFSENGVINSHA